MDENTKNKILLLFSQNYSIRKISKLLNVPKSSVHRIIQKCKNVEEKWDTFGTPFTSKSGTLLGHFWDTNTKNYHSKNQRKNGLFCRANAIKAPQNACPTHNHNSVPKNNFSHVDLITNNITTTNYNNTNTNNNNNNNKNNNNKKLFSIHHLAYSIKYEGIITEGKEYLTGNKKNKYKARRIVNNRVIIDVKGKTITTWLNSYTEKICDITLENVVKRGEEVIIEELLSLARKNGIMLDFSSFKRIVEPHIVIEEQGINKLVEEIRKDVAVGLKEKGISINDSSHAGKIEFDGNDAETRAKALEYLTGDFILEWKEFFQAHARFLLMLEYYIEKTEQRIKKIEEKIDGE